MNVGDSLSGQNEVRRHAGTGSSPVLPTKSQRTRLWKRLRRLDRKFHWLDVGIKINSGFQYETRGDRKLCTQRDKVDAQRLSVRNKLKGYE